MNVKHHRIPLLAVLILLTASTAWSSGLWLYEIGSPDMGTATAGRAAMARDASTAASNPAGMTRLDRSQVMIGMLGLDVQSKFKGQTTFNEGTLAEATETTGNGDNIGAFTPAGSLNYVHVVNPDLRVGMSLASYFGLGSDYGDSWHGRYYIQNAEFLTMGFNPTVAYKANDWLSIGGGVTALYGKLGQEMAVNNAPLPEVDGSLKIDSDDFGYGYNLGILLEPAKNTRIGMTYRSKIDLEFDDVAAIEGVTGPIGVRISALLNNTKIDMGMTIPQAVTVSGYQQLTDKLAVMANVGWQDWSQFGKISVDLSNDTTTGSSTVDAGFDDTWHYAFGLHYRVSEPWLLMLGYAYDTSPMDDDIRSAAMPLDRTIRYATGVEYTVNKDMDVSFTYEFVDTGSAPIDQERGPLAGHLSGEYSTNHINAFGSSFNKKF